MVGSEDSTHPTKIAKGNSPDTTYAAAQIMQPVIGQW
jgi:hypothetical protein